MFIFEKMLDDLPRCRNAVADVLRQAGDAATADKYLAKAPPQPPK